MNGLDGEMGLPQFSWELNKEMNNLDGAAI